MSSKKADQVSRKIRKLRAEGFSRDQSLAIALGGKKKKGKGRKDED